MKFTPKFLATALVIVITFALMPAVALANDAITVTIDGEVVTFIDQGPVIVDNRTLVPVGGVFEAIGFAPSWNGREQTATLTRSDFTIVITIGERVFTTNGVEYELDVPAQIINNRTMLPIRAVLESVGYELDWVGSTRTVVITTTASETTPPTSQIRQYLGVDYTILPREYTLVWGEGTLRWQFIELIEPLNLADFPTNINFQSPANSQQGDVYIMTFPEGHSNVHINVGPDEHDIYWFNVTDAVLEPQETVTVDITEHRLLEHLARFNMSRQYTSDNFHWYSNQERSRWVPIMAEETERRLPPILDALGITLTAPIRVLYYAQRDHIVAYERLREWVENSTSPIFNFSESAGDTAVSRMFAIARPVGSTTVRDYMFPGIMHQVVGQILLQYFNAWNMEQIGLVSLEWVRRGTQHYLVDGDGNLRYNSAIRDAVRNNNIPTLTDFELDDLWLDMDMQRWATTVIQFIVDTFGMEHVIEMNRRHGDFEGIFSFSQDEFQRQWHQWLRDNYQ